MAATVSSPAAPRVNATLEAPLGFGVVLEDAWLAASDPAAAGAPDAPAAAAPAAPALAAPDADEFVGVAPAPADAVELLAMAADFLQPS